MLALGMAGFIVNTSEFIPIALLTDIGRDFSLTPAETGMMLTVYAWVVALMSLPLMLLTRRIERRLLILLLLAVFVGAHLLAYLAWNFHVLLLARVAGAFTHAIFWTITMAMATRVAPPGQENRALSLVSMGAVLAMVLGVPLGRLVGQVFDWRTTMLLIGGAGLLTTFVLAACLPRLPSHNSGSLASIPVLLRRRSLVRVYLLCTLLVTAQFTVYSYIEPFARHVAALPEAQVTFLLSLYGVAAIVGSWLFGKWFGRNPRCFLLGFAVVVVVAMFLLQPLAGLAGAIHLLCTAWGIGFAGVGLVMLSQVLKLAPEATDMSAAFYAALYNVGIGAGALLGRVVVAEAGFAAVGHVGGMLAAACLVLVWQQAREPGFGR